MKTCTACQHDNTDQSLFCSYCGEQMDTAPTGLGCDICGKINRQDALFCSGCGRSILKPATALFCSNCGAKIDPDQSQCTLCGQHLAKASVTSAESTHPAIPDSSAATSSPSYPAFAAPLPMQPFPIGKAAVLWSLVLVGYVFLCFLI